jgi:hypothetical protein
MVRISSILTFLTYSIALLGYAPLSPYLEIVPRLVFPVSLIGGILADRKGNRLSGPIATIVSIIFFVFYVTQINRDNLVSPAVNLLTLLLSIRLISEKKGRNYLQIFALSLFSLASSSLFTLDAFFLAYLIALFFLIAVALVILTFYASDNNMVLSRDGAKTVLSISLFMPAAALPLMCVFFVIMPRTQYPLWNFLNVAGSKVTGFSEKVQPGASSSVGEVKNAAFRVSCGKLAKELLYWRGTVLNTLVGNAWIKGNLPAGEAGYVAGAGEIYQTIYPEPGRSGYLFALNIPRQVTGVRASLTGDFVLKPASISARRVKYDAVSVPVNIINTHRGINREYYLRLPPSLSDRMADVGRNIARRGKTDVEKVELLKDFFLSKKISYATSDLPVSADPLDEFLFNKQRGNCEFFSSSFAVLLRSAGVPSRLVAGYFGGEYNELGGYYLITEGMAHVWVEAYIAGRGWIMVDPNILSANFQKVQDEKESGIAYRIRMYLDSFNYFWNMAVINYDLETQFRMAKEVNSRLKRISFTFQPGKFSLLAGVPLIMLIIVILAAWRAKISREERIMRKFLRLMKRNYAFDFLPSTSLHELAEMAKNPLVDRFVDIYGGSIYRDRKLTIAEYRTLRDLLQSLT